MIVKFLNFSVIESTLISVKLRILQILSFKGWVKIPKKSIQCCCIKLTHFLLFLRIFFNWECPLLFRWGYHASLFLDCCGLIRKVLGDLKTEIGFEIGPWNQSYQVLQNYLCWMYLTLQCPYIVTRLHLTELV